MIYSSLHQLLDILVKAWNRSGLSVFDLKFLHLSRTCSLFGYLKILYETFSLFLKSRLIVLNEARLLNETSLWTKLCCWLTLGPSQISFFSYIYVIWSDLDLASINSMTSFNSLVTFNSLATFKSLAPLKTIRRDFSSFSYSYVMWSDSLIQANKIYRGNCECAIIRKTKHLPTRNVDVQLQWHETLSVEDV